MGVPRLDRFVANLFWGIVDYCGDRLAGWEDSSVRVAFSEMYSPLRLSYDDKEVFNVGSDISFIAEAFPKLVRKEGFGVPKENIPWRSRGTKEHAFRAELRRGEGDREDKYLAVLYESYNNDPSKYRLEYRTNDFPFIESRRRKT